MTKLLNGTAITSVSFTLNKQAYIPLSLKLFFFRPVNYVFFFIAVLNILAGMLNLSENKISNFLGLAPLDSNLFVGVLLLVIYPLIILIWLIRASQSKAIGRATQYAFYEDGISVQTDSIYIEHKWESLIMVEEKKDYLLLYPRKGAAYIIGKEAIDKIAYIYLKEILWKLRIPKKILKP
jgi:hypothetical protein